MLMCVWLSFQTEEALHCVENNNLHELQATLLINEYALLYFRFNEGYRGLLGISSRSI